MEPFDQQHDDGYELVVPFVVCVSEGGEFDDAAYVAGFEMGRFYAKICTAKALDLFPFTDTIRRSNKGQADLIAMEAGLQLRDEKLDEHEFDEAAMAEWAMVTVDRG